MLSVGCSETGSANPEASEEQIDTILDARIIVFWYTWMSQTAKPTPGYEYTYGAKLPQQIQHWASP